jgi:hypothetical protein
MIQTTDKGLDRLLKALYSLETLKTEFRNDDNFRPMSFWAVVTAEETNPDRMN